MTTTTESSSSPSTEKAKRRQQGPGARAFVDQYLASVPPRDRSAKSREEMEGAALSLWSLGEVRSPGQALVRVYNPSPEVDGWSCRHTVVETVNEDMPFLVDSLTGEINRQGRSVHLAVHPRHRTRRDEDGRRRGTGGAGAEITESLIHLEIDQETSAEALEEIRRQLQSVLADVRLAVGDWQEMRQRCQELVEELETPAGGTDARDVEEAQEFLRWLEDNHFTFLGYRRYRLRGEGERRRAELVSGSALGILRGKTCGTTGPDAFPLFSERLPSTEWNRLLQISKGGTRSTVHRPVHLDYVGVRILDERGQVIGGHSFVGLFTSGVYNVSAREIPFLQRKIDKVGELAGFVPASHDAKALLHILETFPRDELFQMSEDELFTTSLGILHLQERQRFAVFVRRDPSERFVSCLVFIPRDRFNTALREQVQEILSSAFGGQISAYSTQVSDAPLARAHFIVRTAPGHVPSVDQKQLEERLEQAARTWLDRLREAATEALGESAGLSLVERYQEAFPAAYREAVSPLSALEDIRRLDDLLADGKLRLFLYRPKETNGGSVNLKTYHRGALRPLSDVLPMLENMGLKVVSEEPYRLDLGTGEPVWICDYHMTASSGAGVNVETIRDNFSDTFHRVWEGTIDSDRFNRLVLSAGLTWREVVMLRAYARYSKQIGDSFSQSFMANTLAQHPKLARLLVDLFLSRHDPTLDAEHREAESRRLERRIRASLSGVARLDQDRVLRRLFNLVRSTLRTNFFQTTADGEPKDYLSFKLDSPAIKGLPAPRPRFEIFVYSPRTEAVHLRGGPVARGGIRWSDRREDFRTEILSLMKAQMVKNAVIVPVGAKGGFVVKRLGAGASREQAEAEAIRCYKIMICGMLDLTDNLDGQRKVVPPVEVVRRDGDDPYLVVAADKGTATFSDIANEVAGEYCFWLGDAFASGGSAGYDHKKMGITARGAWESVKRHFRELGLDTQRESFSVVGVGDMSGDVFGNGMLLSRHIRLLGAFNHLHIFVDPNPDAKASYAERKRLFAMPRSSWDDYNAERISSGGGVFSRTAKSITTTPEMRQALDIDAREVTPNELIRYLLKAPSDLLFFGGIGTFVKASGESQAEAGDRQNEAVRVDARELRCRVVGEGANLALTQRARIELAQRGGKVNTDFIDNSAGVDVSDHEVNIKIALNEVMSRGDLSLEERNRLLAEMKGEVAELVLRDNYLQVLAITDVEAQGSAQLDRQERLLRGLERSVRLDRALEFLPDDEELAQRRKTSRGLTRPEIAILLAYSKIFLFQELLGSDLPEDPILVRDLSLYFPTAVRERFGPELERHPLRREIIATHVTNSMVNRVGPTFVSHMMDETGKAAPDIARAYTITRDAYGLREMWKEIEELDDQLPSSEVQTRMILDVGRLIERATLWLLRRESGGRSRLSITEGVRRFQPGIATLRESLKSILPPTARAAFREQMAPYREAGVPSGVARRVVSLGFLGSAFEIVLLAENGTSDVESVAQTFFLVGSRFRLESLSAAALALGSEDAWEKSAADALAEELYSHQGELTRQVLESEGAGSRALARWIEDRGRAVERLDQRLSDLPLDGSCDIAQLTVVNHLFRVLLAR